MKKNLHSLKTKLVLSFFIFRPPLTVKLRKMTFNLNFRFARGTEGACIGGGYLEGRLNEESIDLNRNFPSWRDKGKSIEDLKKGVAKENQIMMDFILEYPFVLSANFHDGAILTNYPYDEYRDPKDRTQADRIARTPDHEEFYHLATTYSFNHPFMNQTDNICPQWGYFKDGVTNGAGMVLQIQF